VGEEGWKYGWVYEPYSGAVMVLMDEVEQRVRSPQHLCGRLMTTEPWEGKTDRKRDSETGPGLTTTKISFLTFAEALQYQLYCQCNDTVPLVLVSKHYLNISV